MSLNFDQQAREYVITTPQGQIIINECDNPVVTRVVISCNAGGLITNCEGHTGSPAMIIIWGQKAVDPCLEDTQEFEPLFDEDEKAR